MLQRCAVWRATEEEDAGIFLFQAFKMCWQGMIIFLIILHSLRGNCWQNTIESKEYEYNVFLNGPNRNKRGIVTRMIKTRVKIIGGWTLIYHLQRLTHTHSHGHTHTHWKMFFLFSTLPKNKNENKQNNKRERDSDEIRNTFFLNRGKDYNPDHQYRSV